MGNPTQGDPRVTHRPKPRYRGHHPDCYEAETCVCWFERLAEGGGPS